MDGEVSQEREKELIARLESILDSLDNFGEKMAAIKVDEAIVSLCDQSNVDRPAKCRSKG